jgi:hypothetical protein
MASLDYVTKTGVWVQTGARVGRSESKQATDHTDNTDEIRVPSR